MRRKQTGEDFIRYINVVWLFFVKHNLFNPRNIIYVDSYGDERLYTKKRRLGMNSLHKPTSTCNVNALCAMVSKWFLLIHRANLNNNLLLHFKYGMTFILRRLSSIMCDATYAEFVSLR